ncbi:MAG: Gfo/Idh/MocA family oxidoreductase, partial [Abditibacteriaceae bacterium]
MEKIRVAILGCGGMAGAHAERLRGREEVQVVALCDVNEEITQNFWNQRFGGVEPLATFYTDAAKMYAETKPDAVVIVTPHTQHFAQAKQALEASCHVLLEKPMVTDLKDAYALEKIVEASGKIFVVGYNTPCKPTIHYIRDVINSGELGDLEVISGWMSQDWKEATTGLWRQQPALSGGGMLYDSGAHILNSLIWTVEQPIDSVQAFVDNRGTAVDINGIVNVRFANGVFASISIDGNCMFNGAGMTFLFKDGRIEFDGWGGSWLRAWKGNEELSDLPTADNSFTSTANFIDSILGRATPAAG